MAANPDPILKLTDGIRFEAGPDFWQLEPLKLESGQWIALVPTGEDPVVDPAISLARCLATLTEPVRGAVELFGHNIYKLEFGRRQRLRSRIGFVHGYGGLIFNRTVRENISLPVSVHRKLNSADENALVQTVLDSFSLNPVADLLPHQMDGSTRWRACLARALILEPRLLVLEGLGNWEIDRGRGRGWTRLLKIQSRLPMATVVCLSRNNPGFEAWFKEHNGTVVHYTRYTVATGNGTVRRPGSLVV